MEQPGRQSRWFLALYALAVAGGAASYTPFLTIILPLRASEIAGPDAVRVLSYAAFVGAVAASLSNIAFGWISDRTGNRTGWIWAGLVTSCSLLIAMRFVPGVGGLLILIAIWQVAINMMLNPLSAWAGDCVPDEQKGTLGGLLSFAPGVGALTGAVITLPGLAGGEDKLVLIAAIVAALVLPVLLWGRPRPMARLMIDRAANPRSAGEAHGEPRGAELSVWQMWAARLLVQVAEAALFAFLLLWLQGIDPRISDNNVATIFTVILFAAIPLSLFAGRWSDRTGQPIRPLIMATAGASVGLVIMAGSDAAATAIAGYAVFGTAAAVFLALHTSQVLRVLPRPRHRGRDLGIFNLTNTVPSLIMPGLILAVIPLFGFKALFLVLAIVVGFAGILLVGRRPL